MLYGIFTYIWAIFEVNVGEYSIHGAFGIDNYDIRRISWFTWGYLGWFPTSKPWFPIYYMKAKHISVLWQAYPVLSWRLQASYGGAHPVCGCEWAEWLGVPYLQTVYAARHIIYICIGIVYGYGSIPIDTYLVGWTSIYQLFWGSLGTRVLTHPHISASWLWVV